MLRRALFCYGGLSVRPFVCDSLYNSHSRTVSGPRYSDLLAETFLPRDAL